MSSLTAEIYTLNAPFDLFLKEEAIDPAQLSEHELIAETVYSAMSPGTETAAYSGLSPLRPGNPYPRVMGYCNVARVLHTGASVTKVAAGAFILTFQSHRTVFKCNEKTEFFIVLNADDDHARMAPAYLFHLGYHGLLTAEVRQGNYVGVIGAGVLGYTTAVMSRQAGASIFLFTNQQDVAAMAAKRGIHMSAKNDEAAAFVSDLTHQTGLDIIINTSNSWADWLFALKMIRKGGTIVNLGFPGRGEPAPDFNPLDPQYVYMKSLTIKALCNVVETDVPPHESRFSMRRNMEYIIDLIRSGAIDPSELLTDEIGYKDLDAQYRKYANRSSYMLSTLINWKK